MDEGFLLSTLMLLCGIRSVPGKEKKLALALAAHARERGFDVRVVPGARDRPSVVAECGDRSGPSILYSAHLDTQKPPAGAPLEPRREGPWFFGEGVNNMKGALAAMLAAADRFRSASNGARVIVLAAAGEIDSLGLGTLAALADGLTADAAINGEPTEGEILVRHAGVARFRISVRGRRAHVSEREVGANAVAALVDRLANLNETVFTTKAGDLFPSLPMLNIGRIHGGSHASLLAGSAFAEIDIRWAPPMTRESIEADLKRHLCDREAAEGIRVQLERIRPPRFHAPGPFVADPSWDIMRAVQDAHREVVSTDAKVGSRPPLIAYGTDAPHLVAAGIPTCIYGPGTVHDMDAGGERISWESLVTAAKVYERAASLFAEGWKPHGLRT